eukprot:8616349-Prorocentrum_lima.AAC.1
MREAVIQANEEVVALYRSLTLGFKMARDTPPAKIHDVRLRLRALADKYVYQHTAAEVLTA